jgi:hypothetical protein
MMKLSGLAVPSMLLRVEQARRDVGVPGQYQLAAGNDAFGRAATSYHATRQRRPFHFYSVAETNPIKPSF